MNQIILYKIQSFTFNYVSYSNYNTYKISHNNTLIVFNNTIIIRDDFFYNSCCYQSTSTRFFYRYQHNSTNRIGIFYHTFEANFPNGSKAKTKYDTFLVKSKSPATHQWQLIPIHPNEKTNTFTKANESKSPPINIVFNTYFILKPILKYILKGKFKF